MAKTTARKKTKKPGAKLPPSVASQQSTPREPEKLAKRVNPEYTQVKVYLRKTTHLALKRAALERGTGLSDLIEDMINKYLST
jgi:hypothetical protein